MSNVTTKAMLDNTFAVVALALPPVEGHKWVLIHGSSTYGNSYQVALRNDKSGGLSRVEYLGMTRKEALRWLEGAAAMSFLSER